jgi:hypothetical protein
LGKAVFRDAQTLKKLQSSPKRSSNSESEHVSKKRKLSLNSHADILICTTIPYACQWSNMNWSCAYDSVFVGFLSTYHHLDILMRKTWSTKNACATLLGSLFDNLLSEPGIITQHSMNVSRDTFRNYLSSFNMQLFPPAGHALVDTTEIISLIEGSPDKCENMLYTFSCPSCMYSSQLSIRLRISYIPCHSLWQTFAEQIGENPDATYTTSETWIHILLANAKKHFNNASTTAINQISAEHQMHCNQDLEQTMAFQDHLLPSWTLEINPSLLPKTIPTMRFMLETSSGKQWYTLRAIIYTGNIHFTTRFIIENIVWNYDGAKNNGQPYFESHIDESDWSTEQLLIFEGRDMYLLIYGCE